MRVKELIKQLENQPQDARVYLADWVEGYDAPGEVTDLEYECADYGVFILDGVVLDAMHCGNVD